MTKMRLFPVALLFVATALAADPAGVRTVEIDYPGTAKRNPCAFAHKGGLFVFGGTQSLDPKDFAPKNFSDDAFRIDIETGRVVALKKAPVPLMRVNTAVVGGYGYAVGGITHDGKKMQLSDAVYRYDFAADAWTKLDAKLPAGRTLFGLAEHEGTLWVFGGWEADPERAKAAKGPGLRATDSVLTIDIGGKSPRVEVRPEKLPNVRRSFAGVTLDGAFHLVGGLDDQFKYVAASDVFDWKSRSWRTAPPPAEARAMAEGVAAGGKVYLAGGVSPGGKAGPFDDNFSLEAFDAKAGKWSKPIGQLPAGAGGSNTLMFADEGEIVVFSVDQKVPNRAHLTFIEPAKVK